LLVHDHPPAVSPNVTAGVLLCARTVGDQLELPVPSASAILSATGATRSRAYEVASEIRALLPTLVRLPGRPRTEPIAPPAGKSAELCGEALRFVMSHPGCVRLEDERMRYGDAWRLFVLELHERHPDVPLCDLAGAICMPLGTIEQWLRAPRPEPSPQNERAAGKHDTKLAQIETVLAAWRAWHGDFGAFCEHVRREHRLDIGKTMIAEILFAHGERTPARRGGRSRDEHALRGSFETFFPGAQWVGDGKTLEVVIDGEVLRVNLELVVDAATDAAVGIAVTDEEDTQAVRDAFESGVATTGEPPLAMLLDNRPSNHAPEVDAALGDTLRIRATERRPQNKAHVEGAFGLFAQKTPPIALDTREPRALARAVALIVATTFFRAINRAPRRDRNGKSRVDLYAQSVTPEERDAARDALRERMRKQELARQTREARLDPDVRALLDDAFARLELLDPERHVRDAVACYPRDAIVDAIGIFAGKRERGTLDALVDRLVHAEREIDRHFWIDAVATALTPCDEAARHELAQRAARRVHAVFRLGTRERDRLVRLLLRTLWPLE
jgi:hypothetical protein